MDVATEVSAAAERIRDHVRETPVEESLPLGEAGECRVFLKLENFQLTGSFKIRGAMNKLLSLGPERRRRGVVAASTGNHGAAAACGAKTLGSPAIIFVPEDASSDKVDAIRAYGADVRTFGDDCVKAETHARQYAAERDLDFVSPYNDPWIVGGQGTIGVELAHQLGDLDVVFVALGGGGLISGISGYLKSLPGHVEVIACSPENSAVMCHSVQAGRIVEEESKPTLSDGTAGGVEADSITFDLCRRLVDDYVLVSEAEIREAMRLVIERHHMLIEGAAGAAVAGFLKLRRRCAGQRVAVVLCGANVGRRALLEVIEGPLGDAPATGGRD